MSNETEYSVDAPMYDWEGDADTPVYDWGYDEETDLPAVDDYSDGYPTYITDADIANLTNLGYTPEQIAGAKNTLGGLIAAAGKGILGLFKKGGTGSDKDDIDWRKVATAGGGLLAMTKAMSGQGNTPQKVGYQGGVPKYTAVRQSVANTTDVTRRPGSSGRRYFSDTTFVPATGDTQAALAAAQQQAQSLGIQNLANSAYETIPKVVTPQPLTQPTVDQPASQVVNLLPVPKYAAGGVAGLARGRYLDGPTDGMADKIRTSISGQEAAALSHGEFVIPADVVSHLGNGNSEAGAQRLYDMMDRIRQARTGTTKQGKQINPNKYLPK